MTATTGIVTSDSDARRLQQGVAFGILLSLSFAHLMNDMVQSLFLAIYPMIKEKFALSFGMVGMITLTYQAVASIFQPVIGAYTDKRPWPYSLAIGMGFSFIGLILMSQAANFPMILVSSAFVGLGSAVFHPESSRVARAASGGRFGLAQSIFQVGGNTGQAVGPLAAAFIVLPHGQTAISWFAIAPFIGALLLWHVGSWYARHRSTAAKRVRSMEGRPTLSRRQVILALAVLLGLIFSKYFYLAGLNTYFTFYLIDRFGVSMQNAQMHLFAFLAAVAAGTLLGGPIGDRIGRKAVIWGSILGVFPFAFMLPYANLMWTGVLSVIIGLIIASAFSAILVYAQDLLPGKVGTVGGLFFGLGFGMGGIAAAVLGKLADVWGIQTVYHICAYLPLLGLLAVFLPDVEGRGRKAKRSQIPDSEITGIAITPERTA